MLQRLELPSLAHSSSPIVCLVEFDFDRNYSISSMFSSKCWLHHIISGNFNPPPPVNTSTLYFLSLFLISKTICKFHGVLSQSSNTCVNTYLLYWIDVAWNWIGLDMASNTPMGSQLLSPKSLLHGWKVVATVFYVTLVFYVTFVYC